MTLTNIVSWIFDMKLWIGIVAGYFLGKYFNKQIENHIKKVASKRRVRK